MTTRERFYSARDLRSRQFGLSGDFFEKPVRVVVGKQCAASPAGQSAALAVINMAARLHRSIDVQVPQNPLRVSPLAGGATFDDAITNMARAVDPFFQFEAPRGRKVPSLGIGADAPKGLQWYIGSVGGAAILAREPVPFEECAAPSLSGSFAACLGAMALCRQLIGDGLIRPVEIDVWSWTVAGPLTASAPSGPIDVGDVLVIGAGGVGSCFAYWSREFGHAGDWAVADGDPAELHNTNRSMGIFPKEAGWPEPPGLNKAQIAAAVMGATPLPRFYDELSESEARADLVLPLANDRAVRHLVAHRGDPVVLHATTSPAWEAQLHRHIPGLDDCICCRMPPPRTEPRLKCSTAPVPTPSGPSIDAALPFLSAAAGLLMLQHGALHQTKSNLHALRMKDARGPVGVARFRCPDDCSITPIPAVRARVQSGHRWGSIDEAAIRSIARVGGGGTQQLVRPGSRRSA